MANAGMLIYFKRIMSVRRYASARRQYMAHELHSRCARQRGFGVSSLATAIRIDR